MAPRDFSGPEQLLYEARCRFLFKESGSLWTEPEQPCRLASHESSGRSRPGLRFARSHPVLVIDEVQGCLRRNYVGFGRAQQNGSSRPRRSEGGFPEEWEEWAAAKLRNCELASGYAPAVRLNCSR